MANVHPTKGRVSRNASRNRHPRATGASRLDHLPTPTLDRTAPLPGGRAVVGALLVTLAAVGVFAAYRAAADGPTETVVVASSDLPAGHRLQPADLHLEPAELPPSATSHAFGSTAALDGAVTLAPLRAGELVQQSAVLRADDHDLPVRREFSFAVDRERAVNGDLQRGEHIDVLATFGSNDGAYTSIVARDVELIHIDGGAKNSAIGSSGKLTVTVALADADDVLRLAHATQIAPVTLVRATGAQGAQPGSLDTYRAPDNRADPKSSTTAAHPGAGATGGSAPPSTSKASG